MNRGGWPSLRPMIVIPGPRNIVVDALSREPFASPVSERLLREPYSRLIQETDGAEADAVQDVFCLGLQHHEAVQHHQSISTMPRVPSVR